MANVRYIGPSGRPTPNNWWTNKDNWVGQSPNSSPLAGDDVLLPVADSGYTVLLDVNAPNVGGLASLTLATPASGLTKLEMSANWFSAANITLTVSGLLTLQARTEIIGYGTISAGTVTGVGAVEGGASVQGRFGTFSQGVLNLNAGVITVSGGTFTLTSTNGATNLVVNAGSTTFGDANSIIDARTVSVADVNLANSGVIAGFQGNDEIKVKGFTSSDSFTIGVGNKLIISGGGYTQSYTFADGTDMNAVLKATEAATTNDGIDIIAICFMAGTMIRTPQGEVAVEALRRGDLVLTTESVAKPVTWLGRQTISTIFSDPVRSWPIRVKAGALGEDTPHRDLLVSPDHALLVDGVLIHAGALVNGTSIVREADVPEVFVYYHVELDDHSLILAENAPAETFVDNIERLNFDNWAEHEALYPDGKPVEELGYPRAKSRRQVPAEIRSALNRRADELGLVERDAAVA